MATDIVQRCTEALTAILDSATGVQAITGRTTRNCVPYQTPAATEKLPVLLLAFLGASERGGIGDTRQMRYQVTAVAKGNGADSIANALMEAVENAVTQPALDASAIDGYVQSRRRYRISPDDEPGQMGRADLDLTMVVQKD